MTSDICEHGYLRRECVICGRDQEISELQDSIWAPLASSSNIREAEKKILIAEIEKNNELRAELVAIASAMHADPDSDLVSLAETLYASDQACAASQSGMHCRDNLIAQLRADLAASQAERDRLQNVLVDICRNCPRCTHCLAVSQDVIGQLRSERDDALGDLAASQEECARLRNVVELAREWNDTALSSAHERFRKGLAALDA